MSPQAILQYLSLPPGPPGPAFGRWGLALAAVYVTLAVALLAFFVVQGVLNGGHRLKQWLTRRILWWGLGLQAVGLLLLGLRLVDWGNQTLLGMRFLLLLQGLAEVGAAGYLWWWLRRRYPGALAAYEWEEKKRAFLPRAAGGTVDSLRRKTPARHRR